MALSWESIGPAPGRSHEGTYRAKVLGGWLVGFQDFKGDAGMGGLTFVPDPDHEWEP